MHFYSHLLIQISADMQLSIGFCTFYEMRSHFSAGVCNIAHSSPGALHKANFDSKNQPNGPHLSSHCGNVCPFFKLFEYMQSFIYTM